MCRIFWGFLCSWEGCHMLGRSECRAFLSLDNIWPTTALLGTSPSCLLHLLLPLCFPCERSSLPCCSPVKQVVLRTERNGCCRERPTCVCVCVCTGRERVTHHSLCLRVAPGLTAYVTLSPGPCPGLQLEGCRIGSITLLSVCTALCLSLIVLSVFLFLFLLAGVFCFRIYLWYSASAVCASTRRYVWAVHTCAAWFNVVVFVSVCRGCTVRSCCGFISSW